MKDRDQAISHQQTMHVWASYAIEHQSFTLTGPMLEEVVKWTSEAIEPLEADDERMDQ